MQIPPESDASNSGSQPAGAEEDSNRRQTRERDLMLELDQVTRRQGKGDTKAPRASSAQREARTDASRAEEAVDK